MKLNQWDEQDMNGALQEFKNGSDLSIRQLSRAWRVPVATLFKRIKKGDFNAQHRSGTNTVLSASQENELASLTKTLCRHGFPLSRIDSRNLAYEFASKNGIQGF